MSRNALLFLVAGGLSVLSTYAKECRLLPGDPGWPSEAVWHSFNASVDGRLIRTVPIGSPCHNPTYDAEKCAYIRSNWHDTALQYGFFLIRLIFLFLTRRSLVYPAPPLS